MSDKQLAIVVLAAGNGTRMVSSQPKVMHKLAGLPLLGHVVITAESLDAADVLVVVRHQREILEDYLAANYPKVSVVVQDDIPGTGRAVEIALAAIPEDFSGEILVVSGDVPMMNTETLQQLVQSHRSNKVSATILSALVEDPTGYGRIQRDKTNHLSKIVEQSDANLEELAIKEINAGVYVFDAKKLRATLTKLGSHNAQGERYLTDVAELLVSENEKVQAEIVADNWLVHGINDRAQLSEVAKELNNRLCKAWQLSGVTIMDPESTWLDVGVVLAQDVTLHPSTHLRGKTVIESGAEIGPSVVIENSVVRADSKVGPFAYLRNGTDLGVGGKIGSFVETKNAKIGNGSKIPHLSYVGDAEIGEGSNIGAGTIFANYDGVHKHSTKIGSQVRTGSHNVFVAPISIGDGAYTAAGSVIRKDVAPGDLAVNVAPQRNIVDWVIAQRSGTKSAEAAQNAKK